MSRAPRSRDRTSRASSGHGAVWGPLPFRQYGTENPIRTCDRTIFVNETSQPVGSDERS
jgi:hypothetical protein